MIRNVRMLSHIVGGFIAAATMTSPVVAQDYPPFPGPAGYTLTEDSMREAIDAMNANGRRQGSPFYVQAVSFDITRENGPDQTFEEKKILSEYWALSIANFLEGEGFQIADDSKLRRLMGLSAAEFRQRMIDGLPYGGRDLAERHAGTGLHVLIDEHPPGCSRNNGYAAVVMPYYPTEDVASDYGGLMMFIVGAGNCASNWNSRAVLNEISSKVRQAIRGGVGAQ